MKNPAFDPPLPLNTASDPHRKETVLTHAPIVSVADIQKRYGTFEAVKGVTFDIFPGEIFGLLGPNGAGKTTTISMIAGILPPSDGKITVTGENAGGGSLAVKRAVGVTPQELAIYPRLTARENLDFFGRLYGLTGEPLAKRVEEMLELVGLTERGDAKAEDYSGGMKRRLNLASGLMHSPKVFLLDEPTVGVDPQSRNHIFEGVKRLNAQGLTVLYTSHYMEEVEALCNRVGIMDSGKLVACDTVSNLISQLGGAVIELEIEAPAALETLLAELRGELPLKSAEFIPVRGEDEETAFGILRLRAGQPNQVLAGVINLLTRYGTSLHTLNIKEPNLEDVFLKLTGKSLRD